jgi:hypothetical protein
MKPSNVSRRAHGIAGRVSRHDVTRDTTHILTNPAEFQAAYLRAVEFLSKNRAW